jgi:drug/metabolite transporter (DMT)-like permease
MMVAGLSFVVMLGCVKVARVELSAPEVIFWRCPPALVVAGIAARGAGWRIVNRRAFAVRAFFGFAALLLFYTAAGGLAVADLTLVGRLQPLLMAVAAPLVLGAGERVPGRIWGVVMVGMVGCAILLAPELAVGSPYGAAALAAVGMSVCAHLALRRLGRTDRTWPVVFWFQMVVFGAAMLLLGLQQQAIPELPSRSLWAPLLGAGLFAVGGQAAMTRAFALDRAAVVSAASHVMPLFAFVLDAVVFGLTPSVHGVLGGAVVVGAALMLLRE